MGISVNFILVEAESSKTATGVHLNLSNQPVPNSNKSLVYRLVERNFYNRIIWTETTDEEETDVESDGVTLVSCAPISKALGYWLCDNNVSNNDPVALELYEDIMEAIDGIGWYLGECGLIHKVEDLLNFNYDVVDPDDMISQHYSNWKTYRQQFPEWWFDTLEVFKRMGIEYIICFQS